MTQTETLRECHRLRLHLRDLQTEIERGPRLLKAQQARLAQEELNHKGHQEGITKLKLKLKDDEGTLKQTEARLLKLEGQLPSAVTQKEIDAKQAEIKHAKAAKTTGEEAILVTMTSIEEQTARLPEVDQRWKTAQADFARFEKEAKQRLERMKADLTSTQATLTGVEGTLSSKIRETYDYLVKAHGANALSVAKDGVCQGCRSGMPDQKWIEARSGAFTLCSTCGKILYAEQAPVETSA